MQSYLSTIQRSSLFQSIDPKEIPAMLHCLSGKIKRYQKGDIIFQNGMSISYVGMIMKGYVHIIHEDFWGNQSIITELSSSHLFGETYACLSEKRLDVSVICAENCEILFLDIQKVLHICSSACQFHITLIHNLLSVLSEKNLMLTKKMRHITQRSTKQKLLSYLSSEAAKNNNNSFSIPFNRQQLADYLSVDRSAMSNELCKLRDEGVLSFHKNKFSLHN